MPLSPSATRVAVLFSRLGPYHFARLLAANQVVQVTAVEFSNVDSVYAWDEMTEPASFQRVMLFRDSLVEEHSAHAIAARLRAVLSELRPEVVAIPGWSDRCALAALAWCAEQGVPTVVMSETTPWDHDRKWWKEVVKRQLVHGFAAALVGGRNHAQYLVALGMAAERINLGYDAVDNAYFSQRSEAVRGEAAGPAGDAVRARWDLPQHYFLASARFIEKKNLGRLLAAFARYRALAVPAPAPVWDLVLLGDGPLRPELERQLAELGLQGAVRLPGFKQYPELPAYYGLARAFVHASTTEEWGLVVNEAMASGLPVLVSHRCGCTADLVQAHRNGFTFDPGAVEELAQLMLRLASLPSQKLAAMGAASREIVAQWGPERFAQGLRRAVEMAQRAPRIRIGKGRRLLLSAVLEAELTPASRKPSGPAAESPAVARFFTQRPVVYAGLFRPHKTGEHFHFNRRQELAREFGKEFSGSLLECASGTGEITCEVLRAGGFTQATLVDISDVMLAACQHRLDEQLPGGKATLRYVNASVFDFATAPDAGQHDLILCLGLIAHTGRLTELLRLLAFRLKPGGAVLLQSTLLDHWGSQVVRFLTQDRYYCQHGYRMTWFQRADIVRCAAEAGFEIVAERRFAVGLPFGDRVWARGNYELEERCQNWASRHGSEALFLLKLKA